MKTRTLKPLTSNAQFLSKRRAPIHKPTQNHKFAKAYNRRDQSWKNGE